LLLIEAIIATALNVPFFIFFRERPPTPPSHSAKVQRESVLKGIKSLVMNKSYLLLLVAQGISIGVINSLGTVMESFIDPFGYTQLDSSMLAILLIVVGLVGCIALGIIAEKTRKYKLTVAASNFLGMVACGIYIGVLYSKSIVALAIITSILGFFVTAMLPLGLEFAAELTFPVGEALSGGGINGLSQLTGIAQVFIINGVMTMDDKKTGSVISMGTLGIWMLVAFICSALLTENLARSKHDQIHSKKGDKEQQVIKDSEAKSNEPELKQSEPKSLPQEPETKLVAVV
jgi:FLVCR family feline leukemia virus subgroup C receptor-related protein